MFLLDTNIVSELRKIRPHKPVVAWIESVADADLQGGQQPKCGHFYQGTGA